MKKIVFFLILFFSINHSQLFSNDFNNWYLGGGIGLGSGGWYSDNNSFSFNEWFKESSSSSFPYTLSFNMGQAINENIFIGCDFSMIRKTGEFESKSGAVQISNFLGSVIYLLNEYNILLKAGAGIGRISLTVDDDKSYNTGPAILVGTGYQIYEGIGINFDYSLQFYLNGSPPNGSQFWNLYVTYFWGLDKYIPEIRSRSSKRPGRRG
jgi:outer membrane protein with beta-barrel domain